MPSSRPPRRQLSVKKRYQGTWALDRMKFQNYLKISRLLSIASYLNQTSQVFKRKLSMVAIILLLYCRRMSMWDNIPPIPVLRTNLRFNALSGYECDRDYRFLKEHLPYLKKCLGIPQYFILENGVNINGEEALLIVLYRFAYPIRLVSMEDTFGREYSQISRIFNHVVRYVVERCQHLLTIEGQEQVLRPRLSHFNQAIRAKLTNLHGRVPNRERHTALFLDATLREVCRPSRTLRLGNVSLQRNIYNGRKKIHCLSYQGISGPDGIIWDLYGPIAGRHKDIFVLGQSGFNTRFRDFQDENQVLQYHAYTDKGYEDQSHVKAAYHAYPGHPTLPWQDDDNEVMRSVRGTGGEWPFGMVVNEFRYIDFHKGLQIQLNQVGIYYKFAVMLANAHSCLYGNVATEYFGVFPPLLHEYFQTNNHNE
jgi:hypothetical protein